MHGSFIVMFMNQVWLFETWRQRWRCLCVGSFYTLQYVDHFYNIVFFFFGITTNNIVNDNLLKFKRYGQNIGHMYTIYHLIFHCRSTI
jgi:hypothetical protein